MQELIRVGFEDDQMVQEALPALLHTSNILKLYNARQPSLLSECPVTGLHFHSPLFFVF